MAAAHSYRQQTLRITDLVTPEWPVLEDHEFHVCTLLGPAVLMVGGRSGGIRSPVIQVDASDAEALLWKIPPGQTEAIGCILAKNTLFQSCVFIGIGFTGSTRTLDMLRKAMSLQPPPER